MPGPILKLEEQLTDARSDQIAYRFTIENTDTKPIRLVSLVPRFPIGATVLEVTDTNRAAASARGADLIEELNRLLRQHLTVTSSDFRQTWVERQKEMVKEVFSVSGIMQFYFQMMFRPSSFQARVRREFESFSFTIASAADAEEAYRRWIAPSAEFPAVKSLFEAKMAQLTSVEAKTDQGSGRGLTAIEPGAIFTATYVLKFARGFFDPRKYQVGVDAAYLPTDNLEPQVASTATSLQISPLPSSLSVVAAISALLGVLIRLSVAGSQQPFLEMLAQGKTGPLWVGPVVAVVFFNIYEYTGMGQRLRMGVGWRTSLFLGVMSGVMQDRILAAMKAFIGE